jgi:hypothetical protein
MRRRRRFRHDFMNNRRRFDVRLRRLRRRDDCRGTRRRLDLCLDVLGRFRLVRRDGRGGGLRRLDEARRWQHGRGRLRRLRRFLGRGRSLLALDDRSLSEDVARRQLDVALLGQTIDELAGDDLFDRAGSALHLDAVIALEERRHFLARRSEQLRDLINPDC